MRRFQITTVLMLGTIAMFLTGCSRNPVSPDVTMPTPGAEVMGTQTQDQPAEVEGGTPSELTASFSPASGGRLTVGRWTLDLHKNSLRVPAQITIRVLDDAATEVEIEVVPAEANDLRVPAELTASMADLTGTDYTSAWMWYEQGGVWEECADVAAHPNQQTIVGRMQQLAKCRIANRAAGGVVAGTESAKAKNK